MGGNQSKGTPLECMLKNFKKGFNGDYGFKLTLNKLRIICELDCPAFGIGWPLERLLDTAIVNEVYRVIVGKPITVLVYDLKVFLAKQHGCTLLQYMDDLLLAGPTWEDCMEGIGLLLSLLWEPVYEVSQKKAQICQDTIKYLTFHLSQGQCRLNPKRKQTVPFQSPRPTGKSQSFWELQVSAESESLTTTPL
jgi:hypothetical protein